MANIRISALPAVTTVVPDTDVLPLVSGGITTKCTVQNLISSAVSSIVMPANIQVSSSTAALQITQLGSGAGLTVTGISSFNSYASIKELLESINIIASSPTATTQFDVITAGTQFYTSNMTSNFTLNIRGNSTTTLNSILQVGQSATIGLLVSNAATTFYPNVIQIDGAIITPIWQSGIAATTGTESSTDVYVFNIIKTASSTYTVLASQSTFA